MLESSHIVAFAAATDLHRARAFYEQVLGLTVDEQNDIACVFDTNGTMLSSCAMTEWIKTATVSGPLPAATRWPGSLILTAMSFRSPSSFRRCGS
jgi:catechol 2,3-dioxygenase-like lactoylglutathione lyase family enzyme